MITKSTFIHILSMLILIMLSASRVYSQPALPSRVISVQAVQELSFGTFTLTNPSSSGGNVVVGWDGSRTVIGDIVLLHNAPVHAPAIFDINLCQGRNIIITYSPSVVLTGSNGGSLLLNIGPTEKGESGASFIVSDNCQFITQLRVGGTLEVGTNASNPHGVYTGTFSITFNQQ